MRNKIVLNDMIKELREDKHWSLKTMAGKLGIDYRTLSKYEREGGIPADFVSDYVRIFSVTLDYLYYRTEVADTELYQAITGLSPKQRRAIMAVIESYR